MAKQILDFSIIARGNGTGPDEVWVQYSCNDTVNPELISYTEKKISSPDTNKIFHNAGTVGEMWKDEFDQAETDEGI